MNARRPHRMTYAEHVQTGLEIGGAVELLYRAACRIARAYSVKDPAAQKLHRLMRSIEKGGSFGLEDRQFKEHPHSQFAYHKSVTWAEVREVEDYKEFNRLRRELRERLADKS